MTSTRLEIAASSGSPDIAEIFVARTRPGDDRSMVEFVDGLDWAHPRESKWIINVSTQFGCPVGCSFCDAAHAYFGDLSAGEMIAQVQAVLDRHPGLARHCAKLKVHFARMGEPALNDNVIEALERLPAVVDSPGLWACVATTAPCGAETWFKSLLDVRNRLYRGHFQLQFSLNTTDEAARAAITPTALLPFSWVRSFAGRFHRDDERQVVLNFALARGIPFDVTELSRRFDPATTCVKLTPLNPTGEGAANALRSLTRGELAACRDAVGQAGFNVILSVGDPREDEIGSNCGQSVRRSRAGAD